MPWVGYPVRQLQPKMHVQERSARQLLSREKRVAIDDASGTVPVHQHATAVRTGPFRSSVWTTPNGNLWLEGSTACFPTAHRWPWDREWESRSLQVGTASCRVTSTIPFTVTWAGSCARPRPPTIPYSSSTTGSCMDKLWADWQDKGTEFKNLARYSQNAKEMPGAFGTTAKMVYDLLNLPGCVQVCFQQSDRPCCSNTTYSPLCYRDMSSRDYSPLKLARLVHRPFPRVSDDAFNLFHTTYEDQVLSNRFSDLMNAPDKLIEVLGSSVYSTQLASVYQPTHGYLNFDNYLYRSEALDKYIKDSDYPSQCLPYIYGKAD